MTKTVCSMARRCIVKECYHRKASHICMSQYHWCTPEIGIYHQGNPTHYNCKCIEVVMYTDTGV